MTEKLLSEWEYFCDEAYYGEWAVRPKGENRWGHCFYVPTKEEAEGLCKLLNTRSHPNLDSPEVLEAVARGIWETYRSNKEITIEWMREVSFEEAKALSLKNDQWREFISLAYEEAQAAIEAIKNFNNKE